MWSRVPATGCLSRIVEHRSLMRTVLPSTSTRASGSRRSPRLPRLPRLPTHARHRPGPRQRHGNQDARPRRRALPARATPTARKPGRGHPAGVRFRPGPRQRRFPTEAVRERPGGISAAGQPPGPDPVELLLRGGPAESRPRLQRVDRRAGRDRGGGQPEAPRLGDRLLEGVGSPLRLPRQLRR
jgi:hypothetical protein